MVSPVGLDFTTGPAIVRRCAARESRGDGVRPLSSDCRSRWTSIIMYRSGPTPAHPGVRPRLPSDSNCRRFSSGGSITPAVGLPPGNGGGVRAGAHGAPASSGFRPPPRQAMWSGRMDTSGREWPCPEHAPACRSSARCALQLARASEVTDARNECYWQGLAHEVECCCIVSAPIFWEYWMTYPVVQQFDGGARQGRLSSRAWRA
jgi:hypothetical protein